MKKEAKKYNSNFDPKVLDDSDIKGSNSEESKDSDGVELNFLDEKPSDKDIDIDNDIDN
jgi:hypothetical protein